MSQEKELEPKRQKTFQFRKIFTFFVKYFCYTLAVSLFSTAVSGVIASLFALYYFDAVGVEISELSLLILKIGILTWWVMIATQLGIFHKLGVPSFGSTSNTLNSYIIVNSNNEIQFLESLKVSELKELLKALNYFPLFNAINLAIWIFFLAMIMIIVTYFTEGFRVNLMISILVITIIAIFIALSFTYVLSEFLTGKERENCKKILHEKQIHYIDRSVSSIKIKLLLFILLFIINLFLSNTLTYYNQTEMDKVWGFAFLSVVVSMLLAYATFELIYSSLKQIENASYDLMKGGSGQIFSRSLDKEFLNVAHGINKASKTIQEYQQSLEEKVKQRTKELNNALEELKIKDRMLETELNFAADIQKGILPAQLPVWNGICFTTYYKPLGKVSGDYYDVFYFSNEIYVLLGDASGHGVPAALITMAAKQAFSIHLKEGLNPSDIFKKVNLDLVERIKTSDYMSCFLIRIDKRHRVKYSNAAHTRAIYYDISKNDYFLLDTEGMFLGSLKDANDFYEDRELQLKAGDRFYLYTDGLIEHKNPQGEEFGIERVTEVLNNTKDLPLEEQIKYLIQSLNSHISYAPIRDDISMIALEVDPKWDLFQKIYGKALQFLKQNQVDEALNFFQQAIEYVKTYPMTYYRLATIFYKLRQLDLAEENINKFLEQKPNDLKGLKLKEKILSKKT